MNRRHLLLCGLALMLLGLLVMFAGDPAGRAPDDPLADQKHRACVLYQSGSLGQDVAAAERYCKENPL